MPGSQPDCQLCDAWLQLEAFADISAVFIIVTMVWLMVYCIKHNFMYLGSAGNFPYSGFISQGIPCSTVCSYCSKV